MKKLIYSIAFLTLVTTLTSCTADELPTTNPIKQQTTMAKDGVIVPPVTVPPPPPPSIP